MAYEPLHHKYRPQTFGDLVGQEAIANTLVNAIEQEKIATAYLFTGSRGTGKTSSARILAKSLNCLASPKPTATPCGKCAVCQAIAVGTALDVIEIDAASNTGVDNIREIIERAKFAPVQSRYKVYAIDECLTGDSLIQTSQGLIPIKNSNLKGKMVLTYNDITGVWEYKKVLRWLERGIKETLVIKAGNHKIRCTENHLIRTAKGWIEAKNVKEGMKILSPVNVDVERSFTNMAQMDGYDDLQQDIKIKGTSTDKNPTILVKFLSKQKKYSPYVNADVTKNSIFQTFSKKKEKAFKVSNLIGKDTLTKKVTESGIVGGKILLNLLNNCKVSNWDSYMEHYLGMEVSLIQTHIVDFPDYVGLRSKNSKNGWSTKQVNYQNYAQKYKVSLMEDMAKHQLFAEQLVTPNYEKFMKLLSQTATENQFLWNGFSALHQKDLHGGTWMMALFNLVPKEALQFFSTLRDFLKEKIKLLPTGLLIWDILPVQNFILKNQHKKLIITSNSRVPLLRKPQQGRSSNWEQNIVENGCQIYKNTQSPQWTTNLERVESVHRDGYEQVYDLEVEDNHNFVANGLLVHNCHMLSTAAFNALLKTLEEPPPQVVFILATTDPQRVLSTIISRCQRFDYRRIPLQDMINHLEYIASTEKIAIAKPAITLVAQIANGGLRDAESLLDQLSLFPETITVDRVWDLVGAVPEKDLLGLISAIRSKNLEHILEKCRNLLDRGKEPLVVLQNLASFYLNLVIVKTSPQRNDLVAVTETCWQELQAEAVYWEIASILQGQQQLKEAEVQLKNTTQPRLWLEVTLLGLVSQSYINQETPKDPLLLRNSFIVETNKETRKQGNAHQEKEPPFEGKRAPIEGDRATGRHRDKEMRENMVVSQPPNSASSKMAETHPVAPISNSSSVAHTQQPSFSELPEKKTVEPISNSSTVSQPQPFQPVNSQPVISETGETLSPTIPTPDIDRDIIWQQAIALVHPPTTQKLLSQKCHLVSINGLMATIGVVSPQLVKLIQAKIAKIETAFTQACQRKIKVTLEVANNTSQPATNKSSPPLSKPQSNRSSQLPKLETETETIKGTENIPASNFQSLPSTTLTPKPQTKPVVNNEQINIHRQDVIADNPSEGDFQKAVELLAKSFDGEVISLGNTQENLPSEETAISNDLNPQTNQDQSIEKPATPIRNRPDLTMYEDDDDVPF